MSKFEFTMESALSAALHNSGEFLQELASAMEDGRPVVFHYTRVIIGESSGSQTWELIGYVTAQEGGDILFKFSKEEEEEVREE